jgi:hypothetical protein
LQRFGGIGIATKAMMVDLFLSETETVYKGYREVIMSFTSIEIIGGELALFRTGGMESGAGY